MNLLLIRGLSRETRHWGSFSSELESSIKNIKVFCLEMPGAGTKMMLKAPLTIRGHVENLRKEFLLLKSKNKDPWYCLGISMGAIVTLEWGRLYPNDFNHLFLVNTSVGNLSPFWHRMRKGAMVRVFKIFALRNFKRKEELILDLTSYNHKSKINIINSWVEFREEYPINRLNILRQIFAASIYKIKDRPNVSSSIYSGVDDELCSMKCGVALGKYLGSKVNLCNKAGHDLPLDNPAWLIKKINETLLETHL